jgi:hypothetical protein
MPDTHLWSLKFDGPWGYFAGISQVEGVADRSAWVNKTMRFSVLAPTDESGVLLAPTKIYDIENSGAPFAVCFRFGCCCRCSFAGTAEQPRNTVEYILLGLPQSTNETVRALP